MSAAASHSEGKVAAAASSASSSSSVLPSIIAPSILSADFALLAAECQRMIEAGGDWLHVDVMDGHFVPNLTLGPPIVECLRKHTKAYLDVHLMVTTPEHWVAPFAKAGADGFTFHVEATDKPAELIKKIREAGMKPGMAIKPKTPIEAIEPFAAQLDTLLIMTVEPGFGGQAFMADMMPKVEALRKKFPHTNIEVDGGVDVKTIEVCAKAGANVFVSGSGIFKAKDPKEAITSMRNTSETYLAPLRK